MLDEIENFEESIAKILSATQSPSSIISGTVMDVEQVSGTGTVFYNAGVEIEIPTGPTYRLPVSGQSLQYFLQLTNELKTLLEELKELRSELRSRPITSSVLLNNLNTNSLSIQHPISIILEEYDEECLAIWPEVNVHGLGSTLNEAISDLKQNIVNLFFDLSNREEESLGEFAIETLNNLNSYIYKKE